MIINKKTLIQLLSSSFIILFLLMGCNNLAVKKDALTESTIRGLYLVGMGPGDSDMATIRAMKIVKEADLIIGHKGFEERFLDVLKNKDVMTPPEGVWIWHGYGKKESDFQGDELKKFQDSEKARGQIITRVRQAVKEGKTAAVLVNGDPLIYSPWAWILEEFDDLRPIVVPGLSSFNAANAALKKCVTSGRHTKSVILTMPDIPGMPKSDTIDKLARHKATMVIFMPMVMNTKLKDLVAKLSTYYPPQTPIALLSYAGHKEKEQIIRGTLENIVGKVDEKNLPFATLLYVGDFLTNYMKVAKGE